MKNRLKFMVLTALVAFGTLAATTSANACWLFSLHQRELPKSLIKKD